MESTKSIVDKTELIADLKVGFRPRTRRSKARVSFNVTLFSDTHTFNLNILILRPRGLKLTIIDMANSDNSAESHEHYGTGHSLVYKSACENVTRLKINFGLKRV